MRVLTILILLTSVAFTQAQTFTSVTTGNWEDGGTWGNTSPGTNGVDYPANNDNVIITNGTVVTHVNQERPRLLEIQSGGQLISGNTLRVRGRYTNNGTHSGTAQVRLQGSNDTITGTGLISTSSIFRVNNKRRILSGSDLTRTNGNVRCPNNDTLFNYGTLRIENNTLAGNSTGNFYNGNGGVIYIGRAMLNNGTVIASEPGNEVHYVRTGAGDQLVKQTFDGYYDLYIEGNNAGSQKLVQADDTIHNDLVVSGSTFITGGAFNITIEGDLVYSGGQINVLSNQANVIFSGNGTQQVQGPIDFYNVTVDKSGGQLQFIGDTSNIHSTFDVQAGTVSAGGFLRMISNASGDSRIAQVGGTILGDVTVERYIDAGSTGWRFLTSPVSGAVFSDWNDDFITTGYPGSLFPTFPFTSVLKYDESVAGHQDSGLIAPTSASESISPIEGYWVYSGDGATTTTEFVVDATGSVLTGDVNFGINYTSTISGNTADGWNLVANPYVSTIDWDEGTWIKDAVDDAVYVWNTDLGQYASYISGVGTNGGSNLIASSQGFYVKANALSPDLEITEQAKVNTSATFLKKGAVDPILRLAASHEGFVDESVIRVRTGATPQFDSDLDAYYLSFPHYPIKMYTESDSISYSINSVEAASSDTIQVVIESPYKFIPLHYLKNDLAEAYCYALEDQETGTITPLHYQEDDIMLDNSSKNARRYRLIVTSPEEYINSTCYKETPVDTVIIGLNEQAQAAETFCFCEGNTVRWSGNSILNEPYSIWSIDGKCIARGVVTSSEIELPISTARGLYILEVSDQKTHKFFKP